jgi:hypothetical protein
MLGWGIVGLLGAAVGRVAGRRPLPPLLLALACALSAEAFNLVLDLYTWTGTGEHTLAAFGVVLGSALVFDLTHVGASFVFGLAFGPTLLRMLLRVRARLEVSWGTAPAPASAPAGPRPALRPATPAAGRVPPLAAIAALLAVPLLSLGVAAGPARAAGGASPMRAAPSVHATAGSQAAPSVHVTAGSQAAPSAHVTAGSQAAPSAHVTAGSQAASLAAARVVLARELAFLVRSQDADGGFGAAAGQPSSELYTAWAAIGLAAAGRSPLTVRRGGHDVLGALRSEAGTLQSAGDIERTILALHACGVPGRSLRAPGGLVSRLLRARTPDRSFGHLSNQTAFAILALRAAGYPASAPVLAGAAAWLGRQQNLDGGFGFGPRGGGSDVDDTAAVLQALAAAGRAGPARARGVAFLLHAQNLDGGYPQQQGGESNAQSTAWAIQALLASGRELGTVTRAGSPTPLEYLIGLVAPDGSVRYSRTGAQTPVWVTAQALTALAGKPFPIAPVPRRARAAAALTRVRPAGPHASLSGAAYALGESAGRALSGML